VDEKEKWRGVAVLMAAEPLAMCYPGLAVGTAPESFLLRADEVIE
jgi:hypothetical protein